MRWWNLQQLKSKDAHTRRQAVEKLAANDDERSAAELTGMLADPDPGVRDGRAGPGTTPG
jgi:HEAT repeat protein